MSEANVFCRNPFHTNNLADSGRDRFHGVPRRTDAATASQGRGGVRPESDSRGVFDGVAVWFLVGKKVKYRSAALIADDGGQGEAAPGVFDAALEVPNLYAGAGAALFGPRPIFYGGQRCAFGCRRD